MYVSFFLIIDNNIFLIEKCKKYLKEVTWVTDTKRKCISLSLLAKFLISIIEVISFNKKEIMIA